MSEWDGKVVVSTPGGQLIEMSLGEYVARKNAEIERLRAAMQFYADRNRYKSASVHMCGHSTGQSVLIDGGRKAREALEAKP
jgi:hypothetical protein